MINIGILPRHHAEFRPNHPALSVGGQNLTFAQLNALANKLANALLNKGIRKGDKVSTVMTNRLELVTMFWAAAKTGIIIVPSSPMLQDEGLKTLFLDSDTCMVIADAGFADSLNRIRNDLPGIQSNRFVLVGEDKVTDGFTSYGDLIAGASNKEPADADLKPDDIYNIMYSSGTTGLPKGIMHNHFVRAHYCTLFASAFRMTPEAIILHAGSLVFNGAMIDFMPWMYLGCRYILHEAFDPERFIKEISDSKVTHVIMVPSQIMAMLNHPNFDASALASLEMIQSLGAPLLLEYKNRLNELLPGRFYELYGLTEGFITVLDKTDSTRKAGSVGVPLTFCDMKILDETGREVPTGEVGEICGNGPLLTPGYYKRPDLTASTIVDGWLHSGDAGYVDEDGFLYLVDRIKDMIISGGVNVYPKDIEELIISHEDVTEVAVFGVPDEKWGEVPVAAVTLVPGSALDPGELVDWTNQRVSAKFQRISACFGLPEFPRNVAGKTLKREIQENYLKP
jgi:long-chain acyl-CoA synthetase